MTRPDDLEHAEALGTVHRLMAENAGLLIERETARGLAVRLEQELAEHLRAAAERIAACEARKDGEWQTKVDYVRDEWSALSRDNFTDGYAAALSAARDAVRNTPTDPRWNILQIQRAFLAAIDALKGEQT